MLQYTPVGSARLPRRRAQAFTLTRKYAFCMPLAELMFTRAVGCEIYVVARFRQLLSRSVESDTSFSIQFWSAPLLQEALRTSVGDLGIHLKPCNQDNPIGPSDEEHGMQG